MEKIVEDGWRPTPKSPGHKDTKHWCRGKVGVEHEPVLSRKRGVCAEAPNWWWGTPISRNRQRRGDPEPKWWCRHHEECSRCGKMLRRWLNPEECPDAD